MAHIISVINHKGGVGKTTSTANIGAGLNILKKRVLMVDTDPQANLTRHFGVSKTLEKALYGALSGEYPLPIVNVKDGLDLAPSHQDLVGWEKQVSDEPGRELFLREVLKPVSDNYDYIIIDCPPSLNLLPVNALCASHSILITVEPSLFSIEGMSNIVNAAHKVRTRINSDLNGCRVLITRFSGSKVLHKNAEEMIRENYKDVVFQTVIRTNVALEEAVMSGADIFAYDAKANGAKDYKSVCNEIIKLKQW
jgi:chromosome partitioning protein